jgi:hypothetical protein
MMHRPDDWELQVVQVIREGHWGRVPNFAYVFRLGIEAGADLILKALEEQGGYVIRGFPASKQMRGWRVFIPDTREVKSNEREREAVR